MRCSVVLAILALASCEHDVPPPPPTTVKPAISLPRSAGGDSDLRVMVTELASMKACALIQGGFQGLRAAEHPDTVTGVLWIRQCEISNAGLHVTFHIVGNGWLWVDQTSSEKGGTFAVRQYVRFGIDATIRGGLDLAYDRKAHVATLWFTPDGKPAVDFTTIGAVDVDRQGAWSSVVGAIGTVFTTSPEDAAAGQVKTQGTEQLAAKLATGLSVTVDLCTGLLRTQLGRPEKGAMSPADIGETRKVLVEVQPHGAIVIGPQRVDDGMSVQVDALQGGVRLTLVCAKDAAKIANAILAGQPLPTVPVLGTVDVREKARLQIKPTDCLVDVVATPLDDAPARFAWERPMLEIARSTGGALIHCPAPAKTKR